MVESEVLPPGHCGGASELGSHHLLYAYGLAGSINPWCGIARRYLRRGLDQSPRMWVGLLHVGRAMSPQYSIRTLCADA